MLAYNETTGEIGAYPITAVISHVDAEIVLLTIEGETLETTAEHPFYELESAPWLAVGQTEGRWTDALELKAGNRVWKAGSTSGVVQSVEVAPVSQRMYNLTVDIAQTFFVGDGQWLVHNCRDPVHHIATNKSLKGTSYSGGLWTPEFEKLFSQAGMDLDDAFNKLAVPGHKGPHPDQYHRIIYNRLTEATEGLSGKEYKSALQGELNALRQEILDPNSTLNRIVTKR